jgi:hypothetical protein
MIPSTFFIPETSASAEIEVSAVFITSLALISGVVLGALFGGFQWIELRRHTPDAARWVWANLLGWMVGLTIIYLGASLPSTETNLTLIIVIGAASGLLAGLSVGAITGLFLIRLRRA